MNSDNPTTVGSAVTEMHVSWIALLKHITALATGALVFSITFQDKIAGGSPSVPWLLGVSWGFFVVAIVGASTSLWVQVKLKAQKVDLALAGTQNNVRLSPPRHLAWPYYVIFPCFILGILSLATYAAINGPWRLPPSPTTQAPTSTVPSEPASQAGPASLQRANWVDTASTLVAPGSALLGTMVGGGLTFLIQRIAYKRERQERHHQRIRDAYGLWIAAFLKEISACRLALAHRTMQEQPNLPPEVFSELASKSFDLNMDWHRASGEEQTVFGGTTLVDDNESRRRECHQIRIPVKNFQPGDDFSSFRQTAVEEFQTIEKGATERLSSFIATIRKGTGSAIK